MAALGFTRAYAGNRTKQPVWRLGRISDRDRGTPRHQGLGRHRLHDHHKLLKIKVI